MGVQAELWSRGQPSNDPRRSQGHGPPEDTTLRRRESRLPGRLQPARVLMVAPVGKGVGGILSQTNELVCEWKCHPGVDLRVIDTTQRYRELHDERLFRRVCGGSIQAARISLQLVLRLLSFRPDVVHIRSSGSLGLTRDLLLIALSRLFRRSVDLSFHFGRIPELARRRNWEWWLLLLACRASDQVEVLDRTSALALQGACRSCNVSQFANGISCSWVDSLLAGLQRHRDGRQSLRVVFVGNIIASKGVVELAVAAAGIWSIPFRARDGKPSVPEMKRRLLDVAGLSRRRALDSIHRQPLA